jgi:hypothetical protein
MSQGKPRSGTDSREHFLGRWSRRKHAAVKGAPVETAPPGAVEPASALTAVPEAEPPAPAPLPPVESLTPESDFVPFMRADVDEGLKRRALKTLFQDPRFNVMDGLDVYIDDYSKPDPIPPEMMKQLLHTKHIFNPPKTEVNAEGHVVDVVEQVAQAAPEEAPGTAASAISDGTVDANPDSLPGAIDASAEPDTVRQAQPQGGTKA